MHTVSYNLPTGENKIINFTDIDRARRFADVLIDKGCIDVKVHIEVDTYYEENNEIPQGGSFAYNDGDYRFLGAGIGGGIDEGGIYLIARNWGWIYANDTESQIVNNCFGDIRKVYIEQVINFDVFASQD